MMMSTVLNRGLFSVRVQGAGSRLKVCTRSRAAALSDMPLTLDHRSMTSPFLPQAFSWQQKTLSRGGR
jgi:hypothetical protein